MPDARAPRQSTEDLSSVVLPTRWTVFLRTFAPWQAWRFVRVNLKMIRMIRRRY